MEPLISVIIPVYNVEKYIEKSLEGISNQTYKNLEILIIDDGSKDNSKELCEKFAQKDKRMQVISQKNAGAAAARNHGMRKATGEYIMFMDSDDTIHPEAIRVLYDLNIKYKTKLSMFDCIEVRDTFEDWKELPEFEVSMYSKKALMEVLCSMRDTLLMRILLTVPWGKLYHRSLLEGLFYPEGTICEDEFMITRVVSRCEKMAFAKVPLYAYLRREGSVMGLRYDRGKLASMKSFEERIQYAHNLGFADCEANMARIYLKDHIGNYCMAYSQKCTDQYVYDWLKNSFRKNLFKYWKHLGKSAKVRSLLFYISPKGYIKIKSLSGHEIYEE